MRRLSIFFVFSTVLLLGSSALGQDYAVVYDSEDYVSYGVIDPGPAFTWEAQVQFNDLSEALPRGYSTLLEIVEGDGINRFYLGIVNGSWQLEANDDNTTEGNSCADGVAVCTPANLVENVPYHLALTLDGDAFVLYVDGVSVFSGTLPSTPVFGTAQWVSGADTDDGVTWISDSMAGTMDDVRLWSGVIPLAQLSCLGAYSLTGTESGLISYWPMDEVPGTATAPDLVAGANPGSLLGGADFVTSPFGLMPSVAGNIPCYDFDGDGYSPSAGDCDDTDAALNPGATELCDGIDNDCDTATDEDFDADGDTFTPCGADGVPGTSDDDCDDGAPTVYPSAPELCDGLDNDCDGVVPADEVDADADGWMLCGGDCDEADPTIYPGATELCDGIDNDCDPNTWADAAGEVDFDQDGDLSCSDCNDSDGANFFGNIEVCDGFDNDCNGLADFVSAPSGDDDDSAGDDDDSAGSGPAGEDELDVDGDGALACADDCDDLAPETYDGAEEICDGFDNDCDGALPDGEADVDQDGWMACEGDCDDSLSDVSPEGTESSIEDCSDGLDNDCDGDIDLDDSDCEDFAGDDDDATGDDDDDDDDDDNGDDDDAADDDDDAVGDDDDDSAGDVAPDCSCSAGGGPAGGQAGLLLLLIFGGLRLRRRTVARRPASQC
jgi:MYXO-CTERM domain-containing protein